MARDEVRSDRPSRTSRALFVGFSLTMQCGTRAAVCKIRLPVQCRGRWVLCIVRTVDVVGYFVVFSTIFRDQPSEI